jgi:hypothetical protein
VQRRRGPARWQDFAQVVDKIALLQHLNHVPGKPGVASRSKAVDRACQPGLIP